MPHPQAGENRREYISRCVPILISEGKERDSAVAICYQYWKDRNKKDNEPTGTKVMTNSELVRLFLDDPATLKLPASELCKRFGDMTLQTEVKEDGETPRRLKFGNLKCETKDVTEEGGKTRKRRYVAGYASTVDLDRDKERMSKECLIDVNRQIDDDQIKTCFFNHNWYDWPVGQVAEHRIDDVGLHVKIELVDDEGDPAEEDLRKLYRRLDDGTIDSFSIGFLPLRKEMIYEEAPDKRGEKPIKEVVIHQIKLLEISIVSIPCNQDAKITETSVKSLQSLLIPLTDPERQAQNDQTVPKCVTTVSVVPITTANKGKVKMTPEEMKDIVDQVVVALNAKAKADADAKAKVDAENNKMKTLEDALKTIQDDLKALKAPAKEDVKPEVITTKDTDGIKDIKAAIEALTEAVKTQRPVVMEHKGGEIQDPNADPNKGAGTKTEEVIQRGGEEWTNEKLQALPNNHELKIMWMSCDAAGMEYYKTLDEKTKKEVGDRQFATLMQGAHDRTAGTTPFEAEEDEDEKSED